MIYQYNTQKNFYMEKNQTGEINLNNKFFHTMARNNAIDEVGTYRESLENLNEQVMSDSRHLQIIEDIHLNIEKTKTTTYSPRQKMIWNVMLFTHCLLVKILKVLQTDMV